MTRSLLIVATLSCMVTKASSCRFAAYCGEQPLERWQLMMSDDGHGLRSQANIINWGVIPGLGQTRYTPRMLCNEGTFPAAGHNNNCMCYEQDDHRNFWLNTAGAGVGWYDDSAPQISTTGHNSWFLSATGYQASQVVFAHIRASHGYRPWSGDQEKSHPFVFGRLMWMHNGGIPQSTMESMFREVMNKPACLQMWRDQGEGNQIQVDSNIMGLWYANQLARLEGKEGDVLKASDEAYSVAHMVAAMDALMEHLMAFRQPRRELGESSLNFAVTDGETSIFTRFRDTTMPPSLYFTAGEEWVRASVAIPSNRVMNRQNTVMRNPREVVYHEDGSMTPTGHGAPAAVVAASEPLSKSVSQKWFPLLANQMLVVSSGALDGATPRFEARCFSMAEGDARRGSCPEGAYEDEGVNRHSDCFCVHDAKRAANLHRQAGNCEGNLMSLNVTVKRSPALRGSTRKRQALIDAESPLSLLQVTASGNFGRSRKLAINEGVDDKPQPQCPQRQALADGESSLSLLQVSASGNRGRSQKLSINEGDDDDEAARVDPGSSEGDDDDDDAENTHLKWYTIDAKEVNLDGTSKESCVKSCNDASLGSDDKEGCIKWCDERFCEGCTLS